jgi:hypothetical protein
MRINYEQSFATDVYSLVPMHAKQTTLYCFSPPVMLATFAIEITFALYTIWRYTLTPITRLIVALLALLATFQGTEFLLCGGLAIGGGTWSRVGYAAITLLPPLGIHLAYLLANKKPGPVVVFAYLTCAAFITYFVFVTQAISGHTCYANYVTFDTADGSTLPYTLYYYGWLFIGTFLTFKWAPTLDKHRKSALYSLMAGYLALLIPTTTITMLWNDTMAGIPSVMCGFAIILAGILTLKIAPESIKLRHSHHALRLKLPF